MKPKQYDVRRGLHDSMKKNGVLDGIKASLREKLVHQLRQNNEALVTSDSMKDKRQDPNFKLGISMIIDYLQLNDLAYSVSVLAPESGMGGYNLTRGEMQNSLKLHMD